MTNDAMISQDILQNGDYREHLLDDYINADPEAPVSNVHVKRWYLKYIARFPVKHKIAYKKFRFYAFYHAYICTMIRQLNRYGIEGLLSPVNDTEEGQDLLRQQAENNTFDFESFYDPAPESVEGVFPEEGFDFDFDSPYGIYNWELFFHAPMMIATLLSQNQKFEEAQKWFHYIFDPTETTGDTPARYWKIKPFYEYHSKQADTIDAQLKGNDASFKRQLDRWMKDPFKPHAVARLRLVAYMKNVVMKYLDNLIAWGDSLFRRDTIESINEATQLYILAAQILGPEPVKIQKDPPPPLSVAEALNNLATGDSNPVVRFESIIHDITTGSENEPFSESNGLSSLLYFCTSPNDKLLGYWDTVSDRLFKVRNCQNIEGVERSLALFAPPIDPTLLVRASAAGIDLGTILNDISGTSLPYYRFRYLIQKAMELCSDVKALGGALLSALEKKDAEALALLRAGQEVDMLKKVRELKKQAVNESEENIASLEVARELAETRLQYYSSRPYMNPEEQKQLRKMDLAILFQLRSQSTAILSAISAAIPDIQTGGAGISSPLLTTIFGGTKSSDVSNALNQIFAALSAIENHGAAKAGIKGGYNRRRDDWDFQAGMASKEIQQLERQLTAAEIRLAMAEKELQNHDLQTARSQETEAFMKNKFTNKALYNWMVSQISGLYFQSYQLATDVARMAEQAYRYELGVENTSFIRYGHWDSLKKGLLSGERLQQDLRRIEVAYMEQNKREYELTKHVSVGLMAPEQLIELRSKGLCYINVPEVLFDLDHPGQYMRRIKSVSVTIPGVSGSYTNINARLTLLSNRVRVRPQPGNSYAYEDANDDRFRHNVAGIQSIATSSGQNDSGLFELNFRDERYLPFEGAGAISNWRLELPDEFRQFDYDTIADVILHISYTAREGGEALKTAANEQIAAGLNAYADQLTGSGTGLQRVFSLKTHFPNAFYQILQPTEASDQQQAAFDVRREHFPHFLRNRSLDLSGDMVVMVQFRDQNFDPSPMEVGIAGESSEKLESGELILPYTNGETPLYHMLWEVSGTPADRWTLTFTGDEIGSRLNASQVADIYLIMNYTVN